jgi:c-di-GMP-binding flagellar brake protein YcgR
MAADAIAAKTRSQEAARIKEFREALMDISASGMAGHLDVEESDERRSNAQGSR